MCLPTCDENDSGEPSRFCVAHSVLVSAAEPCVFGIPAHYAVRLALNQAD